MTFHCWYLPTRDTQGPGWIVAPVDEAGVAHREGVTPVKQVHLDGCEARLQLFGDGATDGPPGRLLVERAVLVEPGRLAAT